MGTQKAVILTDFCFCLAGSRDCQERGREREGRAPRQGHRARKEPGQEREEKRADEER